eukprot:1179981-Alexandrium_andersonii.AAC.1
MSSWLKNPARGGNGPRAPNGPNSLFRGSASAKVRDPHSAGPSAGGAALRVAPPASGSAARGSPTFATSEPRRRPFGPLG